MSHHKLPHMPLWVFDIDTDRSCRAMPDQEFGRYMRLLIRQWIEGSVPAGAVDAARDAMLDPGAEDSLQSLLDRKFSEKDGGFRRNKRCAEERESAIAKCEANREKGRLGGLAKAKAKAKADGLAPVSDSDSGSKSSSKGGSAEGGEAFAAFWDAYPRKVGKGKAARLWADLPVSPDVVMAGLARCKASAAWASDGGKYIPGPSNWLADEGWHDQPDPAPSRKVDPLAGLSRADDDALFAQACERWPDCKVQGRGSDYTRARMAKLARGAA